MSSFNQYTANKKISYKHIAECILKDSKISVILSKRFGISKDDLIQDCWAEVWENVESNRKDFQYHKKAYSGRRIRSELEDCKTRKTTSVMVNYFLKKRYDSEKEKRDVRLKFNYKENLEEMLDSSRQGFYVENSILHMELNLSKEESVILNWKINVLDCEEAMLALNISRKTLYNKWEFLQKKIEIIYK